MFTQKLRRAKQHTLAEVGIKAPWAHQLECPQCFPMACQGLCRGVKQLEHSVGTRVQSKHQP